MLEAYFGQDYTYNHSHRHQFDHVGLGDLARHLVFIADSDLGLNQGITAAVDIIRRARRDTRRLPVLCLDMNPCDSRAYIQALNSVLDSREYFVLDPDIRPDRSPEPNQAPWPSWLIMQQLGHSGEIQPREYRISMLSGSMRYHRLRLWRAVRDLVRPDDVVVINRMGHFAGSFPPGLTDTDQVEQWQQELPWSNDPRHADHSEWGPHTSWELPPDQAGISHAAFRACVNITNETGPPAGGPQDQCLLSEKTWKAYRAGCLVVHYGAPGAARFLASQGMQIWNGEYCDEDQDRALQHICNLWQRDDVWDQYSLCRDQIRYNHDLILSPEFALRLAESFQHKISDWI
jgi:hypothetical protein